MKTKVIEDQYQTTPMPTIGLEQYRAIPGFEIGRTLPGDELFTHVRLPAGWSKQPSPDSPLYVIILDEQRRRRGMYFYKSAFYDRSARCWAPACRFVIERDYSDHAPRDQICYQVKDGCKEGQVVFETKLVADPYKVDKDPGRFDRSDQVQAAHYAQCAAWLSAQGFPEHTNPLLYWD